MKRKITEHDPDELIGQVADTTEALGIAAYEQSDVMEKKREPAGAVEALKSRIRAPGGVA